MKRLFLLLTISGLCSLHIYAQNSNDELIKKLVEKNVITQAEADELSKKEEPKPAVSATQKVREAFNTPYMRFGGYGLVWSRYTQYSDIHHNTSIRAAFISMTGQINNFKYFLLSDFATPTIHEFWGEWSPSKTFAIRGGQMKTTNSLENQISLSDIETILNTRSVSSLIGMNDDVLKQGSGVNNGGRDVGVMAYGKLIGQGDHDLIQYAAGIYQGTGLNTNENNKYKDFSGSLMLNPIKEFRIGGSVYFGQAVYKPLTETVAASHVRNRWMLSSDYQSEKIYARAEWIHGNDGGIQKEGLYGTAVYYILPKKLGVVGKVDYFNNNKDTNSEVIDYTAGINYYFFKNCGFQLNYVYSDYSMVWGARNTNAVQAQMKVVF